MRNWQWGSRSASWLASCYITFGDWRKCDPFLGQRSLAISRLLLFWTDWSTAIQCSPIYWLIPLHHYSGFRTWLYNSSKIADCKITWHQHYDTCTGYPFIVAPPTSCVSSGTWCIQATVFHTYPMSWLLRSASTHRYKCSQCSWSSVNSVSTVRT